MRIEQQHSIALMVDMQERLIPVMQDGPALVRRVRTLLDGLHILGLPVIASEQYPKGLGPTLPELAQAIPGFSPVEKTSFSCCDEPGFMKVLSGLAGSGSSIGFGSGSGSGAVRRNVVLVFGIEAHVCVLQTVVDLKVKGYVPVVVADCVASRRAEDRSVALERMRGEGAIITTAESLLFELCRQSGDERFKAISKLVK